MHCYKVEVPTTNSGNDCFAIDGSYFDCEDGIVYVIAKSVAAVGKMIPCAEKVEKVGRAFVG